jgi:hypothetical protein
MAGSGKDNGIVISVDEAYQRQFKGGRKINIPVRRPSRPPLAIAIRQAAKDLLQSQRFTARDEAILNTLLGVGLLSQRQIRTLFFPNSSDRAANRRLKHLYEGHLLNFTADLMPRMREAGLDPCYVYSLGAVGEEILALRQGLPRSGLNLSERYDLFRGNPLLMHDLQVSEVYVRAKAALRGFQGGVSWGNEQAAAIRAESGEELVRPDALLHLTFHGATHTYFVEMDRGSTYWPDKVDFYEEAERRGQWEHLNRRGVFPPVLAVIPAGATSRAQRAIQKGGHRLRFLVKTWPDFLAAPFLTEWLDGRRGGMVALTPEEQADER